MTAAADFADNLWSDLMEGRSCGMCAPQMVGGTPHVGALPSSAEDRCPYCTLPVTSAQIAEEDAHPLDERGPDDQRYAHDECRAEARYGP